MENSLAPFVGHTNGHHPPVLPPELEHWPAMLETVMQQARAEVDARDLSAEAHTWRWYRWCKRLAWLLLGALVLIGWLVWERRQVQAFVQVVQVEDGKLVQIGVPVRLLAYTPPDGAYRDMLAEWLRRVYWRGDDPAKAERHDWPWVELHTCPSARPFLRELKARLQPGKKVDTKVQVTIRSITKTPTPRSFQVLWEYLAIGPKSPQGKSESRTTTFTVGRVDPRTLAEAEDNSLGLCVASFDTSEASN